MMPQVPVEFENPDMKAFQTFRPFAALAACLALSIPAAAAPFADWFDVTMPDGSTVRIWGEGDEFDAHFRTEDGRTIVYNGAVGRYEYVEKDEDTGALRGVDVFLGDEETKADVLAALPAGDLFDTSPEHAAETAAKAEAWDEAMGISRGWRKRQEDNERVEAARQKALASGEDDEVLRTKETVGTMCGFTMLVDFPLLDANGNVTNTLATVRGERNAYGPAYIRAMMNEEGWHADGNVASVRDFFYTMSQGRLVYTNVVTDWILVPHERSYYDDPSTSCGTCGRRLITDALAVLKDTPNFDKTILPMLQAVTLEYGTTGNPMAFNVLFAGGSASNWNYGLWAHSSSGSSFSGLTWTNPGGTTSRFGKYQITAVRSSSSSSAPVIGTLCHEDGHMICYFPDYYQYSKMSFQSAKGEGVGEWSLMCSANHLGGGMKPGAADAYSRYHAGWVEPIDITLNQGWVYVTNDFGSVYRYVNPSNSREAFFFENRQKDGIDAGLTHGGLLIWRTKWGGGTGTSSANTSPSSLASYFSSLTTDALAATNRLSNELSLEQANGSYHLERGASRSYSTDPWYKGNTATATSYIKNSGYKGVWNDDTVACARWSDGSPSGLKISHISECGQVMRFFVGDPATWPEPFVEISEKSAAGEVVTFTALVESWGQGNSSIDVYAETGSDEAFTTTLTSVKLGTMTQLNKRVDWAVTGLTNGQEHFVRLKLRNSAGTFTSTVVRLYNRIDESIPVAVEAPTLVFVHPSGNPADWFVATDQHHEGSTSAKSGKITHNQTTALSASLPCDGQLSFWWKASTESANYDWLQYTTSWNSTTNKIGGTVDWTQVTLEVPDGGQTVTWTYRKDGSVDGGSDCGWIDHVTWKPYSPVPVVSAALADDPGPSSVPVSWNLANLGKNASSVTLYLDYATSSSFSGAQSVPIGTASSETSGTYTLTGLSSGTTYYLRVRAVNDKSATGQSETLSATTANPALPDFSFSVEPSETVTRGVVTLSVASLGTGASSGTATVEYSTDPGFSDAKSVTAAVSSTGTQTVTLMRLSADTTYYVRVTLVNDKNKSLARSAKTFRTGPAGFYQPGLAQHKYACTKSSYPDFSVGAYGQSDADRVLGPIMADVTGNPPPAVENPLSGKTYQWADATTFVYEGEMFFRGGVAYNFFHYVDDGVAIELDGTMFTQQSASNVSGYNAGATVASKTYATDGWHPIRIWVYDWTGGKGYCTRAFNPGKGIGWNTNGCTTANAANNANWSTLRDPGDASLLRTRSGAELPSFVTLEDDLMIAGTTLTGTIRTKGVENGCTVTLYAGRTNAGSNTVGWAQSFVAGTVPSEDYNLPFQWDDFCDAGDVSGWFVIARMTNPSGTYEGWSVVREPSAGNIFVVGIQEGASGLNTITATPRVVGFGEGAQSASVCLEYSTDANFANAQTTSPVTATTTNWLSAVTISGLTPNTVYYVRTRGVKSGETVYSRKATLSTLDYGTPLATVSVGTTTLTSIPVAWSVSSLGLGNTTADVFLDYGTSSSYGSSVKVATVTASQVPKSGTYTLSDLPGETTYYVRVRVVASPSGKVGTSSGASGQTKPVGNPVVSATLGAVAQYSATLSYNLTALGDGAASATLYYDVSTSSSFPSGSTTSTAIQGGILPGALPKVGTATVTGLSAETTYYVRVRAVNHANKVGTSATMTVETPPVGDPEVAVDMTSVLQRAATASISIATLGEAAASATITVEYGTSTSYGQTATVSGTPAVGAVLTAAFENLATETTYYVRVTVRNDAGKTGVATTSFRTLEPNDPAFTHTVTPSYTAASFALDVTKIGNGASSASGYVRWGSSSALSPELGRAPLSKIVAPGPMSGAATGLSADTTYYYEVVVTNNLAGRTAKTGSFKTASAQPLPLGEGYYEGGLIQGYRSDPQDPQPATTTLSSGSWSKTIARGPIMSYVKENKSTVNELDGATYSWGASKHYVYEGQMWLDAGVNYQFAGLFWPGEYLYIDGTQVLAAKSCSYWADEKGLDKRLNYTVDETGWHDVRLVMWVGNSNGGGAGGGSLQWNSGEGNPFWTIGYGIAWNTNGTTTVAASNTNQWQKLLDTGNRHLFRARGTKPAMAFLDQEPTWTASSMTVPVRLDTMYDGLTLTVYASRSPNAWYFEDRWEKTVVVGSTGNAGAKTMNALFNGIDATVDWYVSARLSDGANYDYWSDPVKFTPQIVRQPPAGAVTVGTPTFTSNTATVSVTSLGDETGTVGVVLEYATDSSFSDPATETGTAVSEPGSQGFSLAGLQPGRTYYVRARLTGSALGLETVTEAVSFTTPAYTPPVIASVSASATEATSATIAVSVSSLGQGSEDATIEVYVSTGAFGTAPDKTATIAAAGASTFTVTGLAQGTAYFVKVVVTGSNGLSATDASASFVTGTVQPPAGMLAVSGVGRSGATATATLSSLGDSTGAVAVSVEVSTDPAFSQKTTVAGDALSAAGEQVLAIEGLAGETTYYARAVFAGTRGGSPLVGYSETVSFTTPGAQGPAATLSFNQISFDGAMAVVRVTSLGDDATTVSIALEVADNEAMEGAAGAGTKTGAGAGDSSFPLDELLPGRTYWVRATVTGAPSGLATVVTGSFATLAYGAPALGTVTDETTFDTVELTLPVADLGAGSDSVSIVARLTTDDHFVGGVEKTATLSKAGSVSFSWDGLEAGTSYYWTFVATGSNGESITLQGQTQTRFHALALGPASATPADDGRSATLAVSLLNLQSPPAVLTLFVNGTEVRSEGDITAARAFEWQIGTVAGTLYRFEFRATAGGETVVSAGSFTAPSVGDWFNVQWAEDGYAAGTAWNTEAAVGASGGRWTRPAGDESTFDGTRLVLVPPEESVAVLRFTPTNAVSNASDFTIRGETVVAAGARPDGLPGGAIGALIFLEEGPAVWTGEGWTPLTGDAPESGDTVSWKLDVKVSGEGAPAVRYTIDGTVRSTAEEYGRTWIPLPAGTETVSAVGFAGGGKVGDFRGYYTATVVGRFEKPHFGDGSVSGEGGSALSVVTDPATGATTFAVSIDNASDDAVYGVYAAEAVTGPYVRVANPGVARDGTVRTFTIDVPDGEDAQFVVILAAESEAFLPAQFDDPSQFD